MVNKKGVCTSTATRVDALAAAGTLGEKDYRVSYYFVQTNRYDAILRISFNGFKSFVDLTSQIDLVLERDFVLCTTCDVQTCTAPTDALDSIVFGGSSGFNIRLSVPGTPKSISITYEGEKKCPLKKSLSKHEQHEHRRSNFVSTTHLDGITQIISFVDHTSY